MPFSTKETELLGHLTRRLGSDHQAEADAARDRIIQLLGKHGFNFNDYAEWLQAGTSAGGILEASEPERENTELRNEIARLREEAADLRAELGMLRGSSGQQIVTRSTAYRAAPPARRSAYSRWDSRARIICISLIAALPIGWVLSALRGAPSSTGSTASTAGAGPSFPAAPPPLSTARPQQASATDQGAAAVPSAASGRMASPPVASAPAAPGWKPPLGSRMAVVLEDGMILSTPFPSRATEQEISRGTQVAILRQLVANGRQWAEVTCPTASGYLPIDQLDVLE